VKKQPPLCSVANGTYATPFQGAVQGFVNAIDLILELRDALKLFNFNFGCKAIKSRRLAARANLLDFPASRFKIKIKTVRKAFRNSRIL
jgi:hypothetical protein